MSFLTRKCLFGGINTVRFTGMGAKARFFLADCFPFSRVKGLLHIFLKGKLTGLSMEHLMAMMIDRLISHKPLILGQYFVLN